MVVQNSLDREAPVVQGVGPTLRFERRATLHLNGDPALSVFRVRDGLVRITRMTPEGRTLTVRSVMPGDFFGVDDLVGEERSEIAEALTNVSIETIDPEQIEPGDLMRITRSLSDQLRRLMDFGFHLQAGDLRTRVARYLLLLSQTPLVSIDARGKVTVAATHELLAEGTASTRESVSKIITHRKRDGLVRPGYRSIVLLDEDGLVEAAQPVAMT